MRGETKPLYSENLHTIKHDGTFIIHDWSGDDDHPNNKAETRQLSSLSGGANDHQVLYRLWSNRVLLRTQTHLIGQKPLSPELDWTPNSVWSLG